MYKVEFSKPALDYLQKLKQYLEANFGKHVEREKIKLEFKKFENLSAFPFLGREASFIFDFLSGYYVLADRYEYVFYKVDQASKIIKIEVIYSAREDVGHKLKQLFQQ